MCSHHCGRAKYPALRKTTELYSPNGNNGQVQGELTQFRLDVVGNCKSIVEHLVDELEREGRPAERA